MNHWRRMLEPLCWLLGHRPELILEVEGLGEVQAVHRLTDGTVEIDLEIDRQEAVLTCRRCTRELRRAPARDVGGSIVTP